MKRHKTNREIFFSENFIVIGVKNTLRTIRITIRKCIDKLNAVKFKKGQIDFWAIVRTINNIIEHWPSDG